MMLGRGDFEVSTCITKFGDESIRIVHYPTGVWVEDKINGKSAREIQVELRSKLEKKLDEYLIRQRGNGT